LASSEVGDDFELILVNDGSPDGTWAGIFALGALANHGT
jgi:glycosyltransferase involved in cell wall biosynthesis